MQHHDALVLMRWQSWVKQKLGIPAILKIDINYHNELNLNVSTRVEGEDYKTKAEIIKV